MRSAVTAGRRYTACRQPARRCTVSSHGGPPGEAIRATTTGSTSPSSRRRRRAAPTAASTRTSRKCGCCPRTRTHAPRGQREIVIAGRALTTTQVAIIVLSVLAIFFAILAAVGVFDSGKAAAPPVTPPTHPVTTQQTTTQTNTTPSVQAPSTTLKPGDTGQQVKLLQQSLACPRLLGGHGGRRLRAGDPGGRGEVPGREEPGARTASSARRRSPRCRRRCPGSASGGPARRIAADDHRRGERQPGRDLGQRDGAVSGSGRPRPGARAAPGRAPRP